MINGLQIELEEIEEKLILRLEGRVDTITAPTLEKKLSQLIEEKHFHLLLDMTQVDYLSSAGLRTLLAATKKLVAKKGNLILFSLQEDVFDVIKMAGFDRIFPIFPSEKEALQKKSSRN